MREITKSISQAFLDMDTFQPYVYHYVINEAIFMTKNTELYSLKDQFESKYEIKDNFKHLLKWNILKNFVSNQIKIFYKQNSIIYPSHTNILS